MQGLQAISKDMKPNNLSDNAQNRQNAALQGQELMARLREREERDAQARVSMTNRTLHTYFAYKSIFDEFIS